MSITAGSGPLNYAACTINPCGEVERLIQMFPDWLRSSSGPPWMYNVPHHVSGQAKGQRDPTGSG